VHDRLYRQALIRGLFWLTVACVLLALVPAAFVAVHSLEWAAVVALAGIPVIFVLLMAPHRLSSMAAVPRHPLLAPTREMQNLAEGMSIARNRAPVEVFRIDDPSPNIAVLHLGFRKPKRLIITSGLADLLDRDELEAFCSAQMAIADDAWCGRLVRARTTLGFLTLFSVGIEFLRNSENLSVSIFFAVLGLITVGVIALGTCWAVDWWSRVLIDATCIKATRNPAAYYRALRKVALYNGPPVLLRRHNVGLLLMADTCWAVSLTPFSTEVVYRKRLFRKSVKVRESTEMDNDIQLLARAAMLRRGATLKRWRHVRKVVARAERAAGSDGAIEFQGVQVGAYGAIRIPPRQQMPDTEISGDR
jgi:Zn-dependent protease with chaperone function